MSNPLDSEQVADAIIRSDCNRWYRRRAKERARCQCSMCVKFRSDLDYGDLCRMLPRLTTSTRMKLIAMENAVCGRCHCGGQYRRCVPFVPPVLKEFLGLEYLCWACRNVINVIVQGEWGLCWGSASDKELRWALASVVLEFYQHHFYECRFYKRDCCAKPHAALSS